MKKVLCSVLIVSITFFFCSCVGRNATEINEKKQTVEAKTSAEQGEIEIELSMDNVNEYIDFVSIGNDEWILINKQYENDMIYLNSHFDLSYEESFTEIDTDEKISGINGISDFECVLVSLDKPIIKDIKGTITFCKGGKAYFDGDKRRKITEFGSSVWETESTRGKYFNEYPY